MVALHRSTLVKRSSRGTGRIRRGTRGRASRGPSLRILIVAAVALLLLPMLRDRTSVRRESEAVAAPDSAQVVERFPQIAILCYHDITDDPDARFDAVPADSLRAHIRRAKAGGWTFMSLSELLAQRDTPEALPSRVMVLTFDDGYLSFRTRALPVLEEEGVTATLAIISHFVDFPPGDMAPLMPWRDIVKLDRHPNVEIASHAHALHEWIPNNPQGGTFPAVTTRRWYTKSGGYESRDAYHERIRRDMANARKVLRGQLGRDVEVLVWPFGEHNAMARELAAAAGFPVTLALGDRPVSPADLASGCLPRYYVTRDRAIGDGEGRWLRPVIPATRAAQLDLDEVYDDDPAVYSERLDRAFVQLKRIGATHVFLQGCPDPSGDGFLDETWFFNHQAPVRADIWSDVATRLHREGMKVWIRVPTMNLAWAWEAHPEWRIPFRGSRRGMTPWYFRLSPDLAEARRAAVDFYTDLAVYLPIDGVLFDDDAYMLPGERLASSGSDRPADKAEAMRAMIEEIRDAVRAWRPACRFGRNLYAPVVEKAGLDPQFAQNMEQFMLDYDLTVVMAYARMEDHAKDAARWTGTLAREAMRRWEGVARTRPDLRMQHAYPPVLFKLQAYDWDEETWVPGDELLAAAREARKAGVAHLGVYPVIAGEGAIPDDLLLAPGAPAPVSHADQVARR